MGRWVTSKGRRIYIPDENEEVPEKYKKNVLSKKDKQIAANKKEADAKNKEEQKDTNSWLSNYSNLNISKRDTKNADTFTISKNGKYNHRVDKYKEMASKLDSGDYKNVAIKDEDGRTRVYIAKKENGIFEVEYIYRKSGRGQLYGNATTMKKKMKTARGVADFVASFYSLGKYERDKKGYYQSSRLDEGKKKKSVWLL